MIHIRRLSCAAALVAGVLLSPFPATAQEKIKIGLLPFSESLAVVIADKQGFFKAEGIEIETSKFDSGAVAVPVLQSGRLDIVLSSTVATFQAIEQGLDAVVLAPGAVVREAPPDTTTAVIVRKGSIGGLKELEGKRVAVNVINSTAWLHAVALLDKHGVDRTKVRFTEVPFPQMADALAQKRVDAVWNVEPFVTFMTKSGAARIMAYPYQETVPNMDISNYFAKESWIKANPDVVKRFKRAIDKATAEINSVSKEERDSWVAKFTGMKPEVVKDVSLPRFAADLNVPSLKANLDIAVKHKMIKPFDIDTMIYKP